MTLIFNVGLYADKKSARKNYYRKFKSIEFGIISIDMINTFSIIIKFPDIKYQ